MDIGDIKGGVWCHGASIGIACARGFTYCHGITFSVARFSTLVEKKWAQSDLRFCKNEGSKRSKIKGVNWIENQDENSYKMLKIC